MTKISNERPLPFDRDVLGRMVREAWVRWAQQQANPKPSWLVPYEKLPEADKEADRQIGEAVARWTIIGDAAAIRSLSDRLGEVERERDEERESRVALMQEAFNLKARADHLSGQLTEWQQLTDTWALRANEAEAKLKAETAIVDRVWKALGITSYYAVGGKEISELVREWKARAEAAEARSELVREWKARAEAAEARIASLRSALGWSPK